MLFACTSPHRTGSCSTAPCSSAAAQWMGDSSAIRGDDVACGTRPGTTTLPRTLREHRILLTASTRKLAGKGLVCPAPHSAGVEVQRAADEIPLRSAAAETGPSPPGPVHDWSRSLWLRDFLFLKEVALAMQLDLVIRFLVLLTMANGTPVLRLLAGFLPSPSTAGRRSVTAALYSDRPRRCAASSSQSWRRPSARRPWGSLGRQAFSPASLRWPGTSARAS
jgi:hypothetical protein